MRQGFGKGNSFYSLIRREPHTNTFGNRDTAWSQRGIVDPDPESWNHAEENNIQTPAEMLPLDDAPIQDLLAVGIDVKTTQHQGAPNDIQILEDAPTSAQAVELIDPQRSPALPVERVTKGVIQKCLTGCNMSLVGNS